MRTNYKNKLASLSVIVMMASSILISCQKNLPVDGLENFNVTTDSVSYKAGTSVRFAFQGGEAQDISFYSGETLKEYDFKDGHIVDVTGQTAVLAFSTAVNLGTQLNQLYVMASTDFKGDYSSMTAVKAATWTDITARFKYGTTTTFLATSADVTDLMVAGKPLYIAFKYITKPQGVNGVARQWSIQSLTLTSGKKLNNTVALTLSDEPSAGFQLVDQSATTAPALSAITTAKIVLQGNNYTTANDPTSENWAISTGINIDKVNLGPDLSTALKGMTAAALKEYRYVYATPGTYKAVFTSSNNSINETKQTSKTINLTIY
ncbi:MAG: DUF5017 domain-containing protein [Sediminibacterium sp.]|nr:MAG: DUF5017 domain-containing protein [Sediminibacterium sp.]